MIMADRPTLRNAAEYRQMAVKARADAAAVNDGTLKTTYLHLAKTFDELAEQIEKLGPSMLGPS
jgi:hypothetical protein